MNKTVRTWLSWVLGFLLTFGFFFGMLLGYSAAGSSLWLPVGFGVAFGALLGFSPRIPIRSRVGFGVIFGSIACYLWMVSGTDDLAGVHHQIDKGFHYLMGLFALIGILIAAPPIVQAPSKSRPVLWPLVLLMLLGWTISYLSSTHGGASPMVDWVMRHFGFARGTAETLIVGVRKAIHFTFYGLVASVALAAATKNGAARNRAVIAALLTTFVFAGFDELRQSTQPDRTGSPWDVLLDLTGGSVAVGVLCASSGMRGIGRPTAAKTARKSSTL